MTVDPEDFGEMKAEVRHLRHQLTNMDQKLGVLTAQIADLNDVLAQVRGARITLGVLVTLSGALGAAATWAWKTVSPG